MASRAAEDTLPRNLVPFLGAGFSRSVSCDFPLFNDIKRSVWRALALLGDPLTRPQNRGDLEWISPPDLLERLETYGSRRRVVEAILAWPPVDGEGGGDSPVSSGGRIRSRPLAELAEDPHWQRRWYPWKPFRECVEWIEQAAPYNVDLLHPSSPPVIIARLMREGVFRTIVTTNWDCMLELGAHLTGMAVLAPDDDRPPWIPIGDREMVRVIESADDYLRADLGASVLQIHKVNGGVDSVLRFLASSAIDPVRVEHELRKRFLATTSDLHEWEDSRWARALIRDAFRSSSVLLAGVSGEDPATYQTLRRLRAEWRAVQANEDTTIALEEAYLEGQSPPPPRSRSWAKAFALGFREREVRLENVLRSVDGGDAIAMTRCRDGWTFWRLVYARTVVQRILARIEPLRPRDREVAQTLVHLLNTLVDGLEPVVQSWDPPRHHPLFPWLDLLADAVPRWMTFTRFAERIPAAFAGGPGDLSLPTFYLPFLDVGRSTYEGVVRRGRVRALTGLARCLCALWEARDLISLEVDSWTGMTTVVPRPGVVLGGLPVRLQTLLRVAHDQLFPHEPRTCSEPNGFAEPLSFVALFPGHPLTPAEVKTALRLLGDRRCRQSGGRAGANACVCVVQPYGTTDEPMGYADNGGDAWTTTKFLGGRVPLVHIPAILWERRS